ncbi:glycosyltransferase family 2 protein [Methylomonas koyamae]|uniref:glycosyltransferase family 2 protein n=1 Tax=Methylomonas koyamae TaxID=702114 RepID=UPI000AB4904A|nr:glycosyltransferase [Methylomonas koyamae]
MSKVGLIVPTLNVGALWPAWLQALAGQTRKPDYLLLIDSSSDDATAELARAAGFEVKTIARQDFNHAVPANSASTIWPMPRFCCF